MNQMMNYLFIKYHQTNLNTNVLKIIHSCINLMILMVMEEVQIVMNVKLKTAEKRVILIIAQCVNMICAKAAVKITINMEKRLR